jgi:glutathione S-transferase
MLRLFIANKNYSSWSLRPWLLMRELAIAFEEKLVPFGTGAFREFSPTGRVPCLVDGEAVIWDSLAITEYLAERTPRVWPADSRTRAWARSAAAEMHSGFQAFRQCCPMTCGIRVRVDAWPPAAVQDAARIDELWCQGLARFGGPFLAGPSFTAADAFFAPVAFRVQTYEPPLSAVSRQYADRLLALPAMREWYDSALKETWRDEAHEAGARSAGTWLRDDRAAPL